MKFGRYDRSAFGVSVCTVDGQRFSIGNTTTPFTMQVVLKMSKQSSQFGFLPYSLRQSSSKPFTYAVSLNELGRDIVHQYVGQEPSGQMFNELSLDANSEKKS